MSIKKSAVPKLGGTATAIDTHCHLDMAAYRDDLGKVLKRARDNGIQSIVTIGIDFTSSRAALKLSMQYDMISCSAGIHPHDVENTSRKELESLESMIDNHSNYIVAYGEIGLDYVKQYSDPAIQRKSFRDQLIIAKNCNKPVIIHDREAHDDILKILNDEGPFKSGGVLHCFSGDLEYAKRVLDLGFYISIPGIVTFKNATALKQVARSIPLESLLIETDGPFLAPAPFRGKRNEPSFILYTAQEIARLREVSLDYIATATTANAQQLFNI